MHYAPDRHLIVTQIVFENIEIDQVGCGIFIRDQQLHRIQAALQFSELKTELYAKKTATLENVILNNKKVIVGRRRYHG